MPLVLAHQGGWDEALAIAVPLAFFGFLLWIGNRRARQIESDRTDDSPPND